MTKPYEETWEHISGAWPMEVTRKGQAHLSDGKIAEVWAGNDAADLIASAPELYRLLADLLTHPMGLHPLAKPRVDAIKIGWTSDVVRRVKEIRKETGGGVSVVLLACIPGNKPMELALHARFADDRVDPNDEWFRASDRLVEFVTSLGRFAA